MTADPAPRFATPAAPAAAAADPRWARVLARDASADGEFYYGVVTTGVYCRPSCASRAAKPENVRILATIADCEAAGFRPCKRCRPRQPSLAAQNAQTITAACRMIEQAETPPSLAALARAAGLSPHHFHRMFKALTGVTPRAYAAAHRGARLRDQLVRGARVTEALYDAGFNSSGRFYAAAGDLLGMSPTGYRTGGAGAEIRFAIGQCSLGAILVALSDKGVCAILMGDDPDALARDLQDRFGQASLMGADPAFEPW